MLKPKYDSEMFFQIYSLYRYLPFLSLNLSSLCVAGRGSAVTVRREMAVKSIPMTVENRVFFTNYYSLSLFLYEHNLHTFEDTLKKKVTFQILCTGAADFLNVLKNAVVWGGGVLLVHGEIYYVPVDDGWDQVLVRNVLHYIPVLHPGDKQ